MRTLSIAAMFMAVLVFTWGRSEYVSYLALNRPGAPDQEKGQVVERKFKGGPSIFITRSDMYIETSITLAAMALFVAGATGLRRYYPAGAQA